MSGSGAACSRAVCRWHSGLGSNFLPLECHSRRTPPASLTWSGGEAGRHRWKVCKDRAMQRRERGDIRMPLRTPFFLLLKMVLLLPFHHLMIYIPSAIFKMTLNAFFVCSKFALVICMCKQSVCLCVCVCLIPHGRAAVEARQHRCLCSLRSTSLPLPQTPHK